MSNPAREISRMLDKRKNSEKKSGGVVILENAGEPVPLDKDHTHDDRYYTEGEMDAKLAQKSPIDHNHDLEYAGINHSHAFSSLPDTPDSYEGEAGKFVSVKQTEDGVEFVAMTGGGDMLKSVYDADNDGKVDEAENTQKIDGIAVDTSGISDGYILYYDSVSGVFKVKQDDVTGGGSFLFGSGLGVTISANYFIDINILSSGISSL